jgi:type IV secretion system protein TrbJ
MCQRKLIVVLSLVLWVQSAWAQFAVEDVYVGVQTAITALNSVIQVARQAEQIANEVLIIKNQLEQLAYDAANLTRSPLQLLSTLSALVGQYEAILARSQGLGFQLGSIERRIEPLYPLFGQPVRDVQSEVRQIALWVGEVRHASVTALQAQAIQERLAAQRGHLERVLTESEASAGALAVAQNTNQVLGILVEQNASMQQIYAASARAKVALDLAQAAMADRAWEDAMAHVSGLGAMEEVKSIGIPEFR